ncbi:MAG: rod-binding protein [Clostridiales bacterium]|jgi:flagellar protein FlgJ|nr:rod-binding protein [Clostridiales bacterium]
MVDAIKGMESLPYAKTGGARLEAARGSFEAELQKAAEFKDAGDLKKACSAFESYFFQMMFREMRKTCMEHDGGSLPAGNARAIFQDMLDEEYSKSAAQSGSFGLADMMYKQMSRSMHY